jgi:5-methyltetrahydropteroyltriglutamate--homocysteine methyltransferase
MAEDCAGFRSVLDAAGDPFAEAFMTAPSPGMVACAMRNRHYDTEARYLAALGQALANEYRMIVESGFLLQLDCPDLALERHVTYKDRSLSEFLAFVESVVETINRALGTIPADRVRMHVCWGNYDGPHDSDVELDAILPLLLKANVGGLVLPFANGRHAHDYHCFERYPLGADQVLVAGVIDTLSNVVEHPRTVAERLVRIAEAVGDPRRVLAGTDCGFDTAAGSGRVAPDVVWAKLAAQSEGARLASRHLFGG